jgi:hypothetical protein
MLAQQVNELTANVAKLERERDTANDELVTALARASVLESELAEHVASGGERDAEAAQLQRQVDLAMEMIGERNTRVRGLLLSSLSRHVSEASCAMCCRCHGLARSPDLRRNVSTHHCMNTFHLSALQSWAGCTALTSIRYCAGIRAGR